MQTDRFILIPTLQVRPGMLLVYNKFDPCPPRGKLHKLRKLGSSLESPNSPLENFKGKEAYSGQLNPCSRKRLQRAINLLVEIAEPKTATNFKTGSNFTFKVNFITLTLPQAQGSISDKQIKKSCLDNWLKTMRRRYDLKSYVWRAERQMNGNVHFHITTDTYLPYDQIKDVWNHQLIQAGLMDRFEKQHGHTNPNSTDVHSVQGIRNLASYMVKYMSKSPADHLETINNNRIKKGLSRMNPALQGFRKMPLQPNWDDPIKGKVWDCSQNLKIKTNCEIIIDSEVSDHLRLIQDTFPNQSQYNDHCWMFFFDQSQARAVLSGLVLTYWLAYLAMVKNYHETLIVNSTCSKLIASNGSNRNIHKLHPAHEFDLKVRY